MERENRDVRTTGVRTFGTVGWYSLTDRVRPIRDVRSRAAEATMDQYSPAELSALFMQGASFIETQFQFWIWTTFATVVAGFVAGDRLTLRFRYLVAMLYVLAAWTLLRRSQVMAAAMLQITDTLDEAGATIFPLFGPEILLPKAIVFFLGTVAAVYFLLASNRSVERAKRGTQ